MMRVLGWDRVLKKGGSYFFWGLVWIIVWGSLGMTTISMLGGIVMWFILPVAAVVGGLGKIGREIARDDMTRMQRKGSLTAQERREKEDAALITMTNVLGDQ